MRPAGRQPAGAAGPWGFTGDAGVYRDPDRVQRQHAGGGATASGPCPTRPQGSQALYVSGTGAASGEHRLPAGRGVRHRLQGGGRARPGHGQPARLLLRRPAGHAERGPGPDGRNPNPWRPGNGVRDPNAVLRLRNRPGVGPGPGRHTFRIVGRGAANQTTVIDDVRVAQHGRHLRVAHPGRRAGGRAGVAVGLPGPARGTRPSTPRRTGSRSSPTRAGGRSGGDTQSVPIQSWAKYRDGRAADVMAAAIDTFYKAGGELNVLGTYDQWYLDDAANASELPTGPRDRLAAGSSPCRVRPQATRRRHRSRPRRPRNRSRRPCRAGGRMTPIGVPDDRRRRPSSTAAGGRSAGPARTSGGRPTSSSSPTRPRAAMRS